MHAPHLPDPTGSPYVPPKPATKNTFWRNLRELMHHATHPHLFDAFLQFATHKHVDVGEADGLTMEGTASFVAYTWDFRDPTLVNVFTRFNTEVNSRALSVPLLPLYWEFMGAAATLVGPSAPSLFCGMSCALKTVSSRYVVGSVVRYVGATSTTTSVATAKGRLNSYFSAGSISISIS